MSVEYRVVERRWLSGERVLYVQRRMPSGGWGGSSCSALDVVVTGTSLRSRGTVSGRTSKSRARLRRRLETAMALGIDLGVMVTLTTKEKVSGRAIKGPLHRWMQGLVRKYRPELVIWVLEFQARGAAHVHAVTTCYLPMEWVARAWESTGMAPAASGTRVERVRRPKYLMKYCGKQGQEVDPLDRPTGRTWGMRGSRSSEVSSASRGVVEYVGAATGDKDRCVYLQKAARPDFPGQKVWRSGDFIWKGGRF